MNRRRQIQNARTIQEPTVSDALANIAGKFQRLSELRQRINELKGLYQEHDALQSELLSLFVQKTDSQFVIARQFTVGGRTYRLTPFFYDQAKGTLLAKRWKSTAHETFTIE
jgi:hypothetical protein